MSLLPRSPAELFTVEEIAVAAGTTVDEVRAVLEDSDSVQAGSRFVPFDRAVQVVRTVRARRAGVLQPQRLFAANVRAKRHGGVPLAASGAFHAALLAAMIVATSLGVRSEPTTEHNQDTARLVFLSSPGPGGGGGGGGLRKRLRPPESKIRGTSKLRSPISVVRKQDRREVERRIETPPQAPRFEPLPESPPAPQASPTPPIVAPVVSVPSDAVDRAGVLAETDANVASHGPGSGGGTGTGRGTGSGEGDGAGLGDGSIAGVGGGPYRPGAGITPPNLLREIKPVYTEEGRTRGVEGEVVMEVVVRSDGSVGSLRILRGLGSGLDQRAADAVRQWKFSPARRYGTPVDVLVEVAVEFRLR